MFLLGFIAGLGAGFIACLCWAATCPPRRLPFASEMADQSNARFRDWQ